MDAAHYLAELTRLVRQAQDLPTGSEVKDSHGNLWTAVRGKDPINMDEECFYLTHQSNEKRATVALPMCSNYVFFNVRDIEV